MSACYTTNVENVGLKYTRTCKQKIYYRLIKVYNMTYRILYASVGYHFISALAYLLYNSA